MKIVILDSHLVRGIGSQSSPLIRISEQPWNKEPWKDLTSQPSQPRLPTPSPTTSTREISLSPVGRSCHWPTAGSVSWRAWNSWFREALRGIPLRRFAGRLRTMFEEQRKRSRSENRKKNVIYRGFVQFEHIESLTGNSERQRPLKSSHHGKAWEMTTKWWTTISW